MLDVNGLLRQYQDLLRPLSEHDTEAVIVDYHEAVELLVAMRDEVCRDGKMTDETTYSLDLFLRRIGCRIPDPT